MEYTKEGLMFTWGVVESKEHAEFIIELAELHGFELTGASDTYGKFFCFDGGSICFVCLESIAKQNCKKITIPLPQPKEKEWPQVGDEVLFTPNPSLGGSVLCVVRFIGVKHILLVGINGKEYSKRKAKAVIEKPKSKQDLLIEDLHQKLLANNYSDEYLLACDIVQGKIEGLSYEG